MRLRRFFFGLTLFLGGLTLLYGLPATLFGAKDSAAPLVYIADVEGTINPALADYITKGIDKAKKRKAAALIIRMDTPGGLLTTTKDIIKDIVNSDVPIIVYVAPSGSSATSAGALITFAADIAAMAPGTNIGAAHPVSGSGEDIPDTMKDKVLNDLTAYMRSIVKEKGRNEQWVERAIRASASATAEEALELKAIDVVSDSVTDLLKKIDGREIKKKGRTIAVKTAGAREEVLVKGWRFGILDVVADPNVAYLLLTLGGLCVLIELYNPGMIFPIVLGAICLVLAGFALQVLPVNYVGILLLILAVVLFILEVKITSYGLLSVAAIFCLVLGSIMLFDPGEVPAVPEGLPDFPSGVPMRVSWSVLIPVVLMISAFFVFAMGLAARAWMTRPRTGQVGMEGEVGIAATDLDNEGRVDIHGEYWHARSDGFIPKGEKVRVVRVERLTMIVTKDFQ